MIKHRSHCIYLALGQPMVGSDCLEPRFLARSLGKTFSSSPLAKQPDKTKAQGMGILPFKDATSYITTASPSCCPHHWITRDSHKPIIKGGVNPFMTQTSGMFFTTSLMFTPPFPTGNTRNYAQLMTTYDVYGPPSKLVLISCFIAKRSSCSDNC